MADTKNTSAVAPSDAHLNALNQETDYSAGMHDGFDADGGAGTTANGDADSPFGGSSSRPAAAGGGPGARTGAPKNSALVTVQPLQKKDMQPSYAQDLGTDELGMGFYGSLINCLGAVAGGLGQFPCCPCPNPFKSVEQGSVGLVSRFGKFYKAVDPGLVKINPCSENLRRVNVKIQLSNIPRQTVMTKDNVNVQIDSVLYWHISNPYSATFGINDVTSALIERAQTTLRDVVGSRNLQSVIADREGVALQVEEIVESVAERWGVTVESILIKDIVFSKELQESLSSAATQTRIGQSKVIAARAEVDAAKLMRQAADVLSSKAALQLRELDALQAMAKSANSKVIFVPVHLQSGTAGGAGGPAAIAGGSGSGTAAGDPSTAAASGQGAGGVFNAAQLNEMANM